MYCVIENSTIKWFQLGSFLIIDNLVKVIWIIKHKHWMNIELNLGLYSIELKWFINICIEIIKYFALKELSWVEMLIINVLNE